MTKRHNKTYVQIGLNILYYRKERGLTQQKLAEKINYSRNQVQRVETAYTVPSIDILLDIANILEIDVTKLFETRV